jgi:NTE family protein
MISMDFSFARRHLLKGAFAGAIMHVLPIQAAPAPGKRRKLAVVLGGGSARGFAHIGVIKALEAGGIRPDLIVGCSAGSLVGAFWAAGYTGARMEALAMKVQDSEVIDLVSSTHQYGLVAGRSLQSFVNQGVDNRSMENLRTPFAAVATRYPTGELTVFNEGDTGFAVRASCSIPGVFMPASTPSGDFLDGGLISPVPVATARKLGADLVIAVDVGGPDPASAKPGSESRGLYNVIMRSFEIMSQALRQHETSAADIVIRPDVGRVQSTDFSSRRLLITLGEHAGKRLVPVILSKMNALPKKNGQRLTRALSSAVYRPNVPSDAIIAAFSTTDRNDPLADARRGRRALPRLADPDWIADTRPAGTLSGISRLARPPGA